MATFGIIDTETTGTGEEDRIIQVGGIFLDSNGSAEFYDEMCYTDKEIDFLAMATHHITPEMIAMSPKYEKTEFAKALEAHSAPSNYLLAHNMPFDLPMLQKEGFDPKYQIIDTLRVSRHVFDDHKSHKLQYFRYALGLYKTEMEEAKKYGVDEIKAHSALGDVITLTQFLSKLVERIKERFPGENPMSKMVELTNTPVIIKEFTFGKHKGKPIADVAQEDLNYLSWMRNNMEGLSEDMVATLDLYLSK